MTGTIYGRDEVIEKIKIFAESHTVGNQAFLGVKGVGKTTLFQHYFTREKRRELARDYKKLFVFTQLDARKKGTDLYQFLLDQVKMGILVIPDPEVRGQIREEMTEIDDIFETPDGRLDQYLTLIREREYDLILIMDQFHCMARDSEIGKEQYDVLRSYNEKKLITYWIITDTDLMETCATKQYIASFFAQKFTSKMTIIPVPEQYCAQIVGAFVEQKKVHIEEEDKTLIISLCGGVPDLISILTDMIAAAKNGKCITGKELEHLSLENRGCVSLFESWVSGLNSRQKRILYDVAASDEQGVGEADLSVEISRMAELSDEVGRGLLHVKKDISGRTWTVGIPLFRYYISSRGIQFYEEEGTSKSDASKVREQQITNVFHIQGDFIQSQTNNILNIENAIQGLEDLQRLFEKNQAVLDMNQVKKKLEYLPFNQNAWEEMPPEGQEEELDKYADGIFSSEIFKNGELTAAQKKQFALTDSLLGALSPSCYTQIVCGIQVYGLIQMCIDNFGLNMSSSESPRGILFVRAFEKHLKDVAAPAYNGIPEFADHMLPGNKRFCESPLDKTTIGNYSSILQYHDNYMILAEASRKLLGKQHKDKNWWQRLTKQICEIGILRNQCCHSGTSFDHAQLMHLTELVFSEKAFEKVLVFKEIPPLKKGQFSFCTKKKKNKPGNSPGIAGGTLNLNLLGKRVTFVIKERTARGSYRGLVEGRYEASLPKSFASKMEFAKVKNTTIAAVVDKIQDGKYILKM